MTKSYYECHITMNVDRDKAIIKAIVEYGGWTFSAIDEDIVLGPGVKCYATHHYNRRFSVPEVKDRVNEMGDYLADNGLKVIRRKVELVLHDERAKV